MPKKTADPAAPTVLVYGHYDVMPVNPAGEWTNGPFDPVIREGRIWARGANDDKGQSYMHLKAMEAMLATGTLPCNLKFMLEGEEEIGSASLGKWCTEHQELLKADVILVSDTSLLGWKTPSITCGLRGLCYMEIEVTGPNKELHSGLYGGAVANPANVLARLIAALTDEEGRITIPHFYDTVRELTPAEREAFGKASFCEAAYRKGLGIRSTQGETGYTTMERTGIRPSLDVNGIWSGYTGEGTKTVIPSKACAKNLDAAGARPGLPANRPTVRRVHAGARTCGRKRKCTGLARGYPYLTPTDLPAYRAAAAAVEETFGKEPLPYYSGGSIPIISTFEKVLGLKSVLLGFGLDQDAIHSPNESYALEKFLPGHRYDRPLSPSFRRNPEKPCLSHSPRKRKN